MRLPSAAGVAKLRAKTKIRIQNKFKIQNIKDKYKRKRVWATEYEIATPTLSQS
jgi:hypothetical protein